MKTDQSAFLNHLLDAIMKIEKYIQNIDEESFMKNDLVQDGVIRQIEIIAEPNGKAILTRSSGNWRMYCSSKRVLQLR